MYFIYGFYFTKLCAKYLQKWESVRYRATNKSCLRGVSTGHAGREAAFFGRDRCRYVGRVAALWKYSVNSRNSISKWKLLNVIKSKEEISTLKYKIYHKYTVFQPTELKSLSCSERNVLHPLLHLAVFFSRSNFLPQSKHFFMKNKIVQPVSATHTFDPVIFLTCLQVVSPALTAFRVRIFRCFLIRKIFF
jgi:hypothetical protein